MSRFLCVRTCSYLDKVKVPPTGEEVAPGDEVALRLGHRALAEISVKTIYESMCLVRRTGWHTRRPALDIRLLCRGALAHTMPIRYSVLSLRQDMMGVEPDAAHLAQIDRDAQLKHGGNAAPRSNDESAAAAAVAAAMR